MMSAVTQQLCVLSKEKRMGVFTIFGSSTIQAQESVNPFSIQKF